ncbi:MAG: thiamine pyrophosphate-dependent enzyme [Myxococcota bacterium]
MGKYQEEDYKSKVENAWCSGCGNFGILNTVKQTLAELDIGPHQAVICTGIGQAPKLPHYMKVNTFNGLHGREVASAQGIKMANPELEVIVHGGDGGIYGEGGNHFLHAIRRNLNITVVVHDNRIYGLTKGQPSPTSEVGLVTGIKPEGVQISPLKPLKLAVSQECSFVAQAFSANIKENVEILKAAILNEGFSLVNMLQPCITWNKVNTYKWFRDNTFTVDSEHDPYDSQAALELLQDKLPLGIIYKNKKEAYDSKVAPARVFCSKEGFNKIAGSFE